MGKRQIEAGTCELCLREDIDITVHHLTPKEMGGTPSCPPRNYAYPAISRFTLYIRMQS